jgi:PAS domain S-box-containing protein
MNAKRSASQKLLKASEERYRSLVDNIELGITLVDDQYRVVMTNTAQGALLKRPARELVGRYCFKEFEKRDTVCPHCPGKEAMQTGSAAVAETGGVRDDGSRISVRINAFPLKDDHGRAKGFIEVVEDITARKKHEEELKQTYEKLREQNLELKKLDRIKDALISDVSHELKTPVAKHQMYLEVLKSVLERGAPMGRIESVIQILEEGVRRQQQVIRNILVLSRLEEGGHGFERKTVLLGEIVKEVLADYGELTGTLGINIQTQLNPVEIETDREMLLHVVSNLVENSIKYRSPEKPRILVTVGAEEGRPVISVQDNGIGMTAEERKRALDRFYQSTVSKEGIGLGLHICKRIVKRLGGEITLSSAGRGRGTEVKVTMPPLSG